MYVPQMYTFFLNWKTDKDFKLKKISIRIY